MRFAEIFRLVHAIQGKHFPEFDDMVCHVEYQPVATPNLTNASIGQRKNSLFIGLRPHLDFFAHPEVSCILTGMIAHEFGHVIVDLRYGLLDNMMANLAKIDPGWGGSYKRREYEADKVVVERGLGEELLLTRRFTQDFQTKHGLFSRYSPVPHDVKVLQERYAPC